MFGFFNTLKADSIVIIESAFLMQRVSRSQDGDISPLPTGRGPPLGEIGEPSAFLSVCFVLSLLLDLRVWQLPCIREIDHGRTRRGVIVLTFFLAGLCPLWFRSFLLLYHSLL
jgi:hypothetical protein